MLNFLYFVALPRQEINAKTLQAAGLGDVLRDRMTLDDLANKGRLAFADVLHGPGGAAGTIVYPLPTEQTNDEADGLGYYPVKQKWEQIDVVGSKGYWLGWDPSHLPTPENLQREKLVSGYIHELGDGQQWECPIIRFKEGKANLPDVWGVVNGKVVSRVKPAWQWAWDLTGVMWDQLVSGIEPSAEVAYSWCAKLLSINYRVGLHELSVLNVLGTTEASTILRTAINGPLIELLREEQKKSHLASTVSASTFSPGSGDSTPDSPPVAPTSI